MKSVNPVNGVIVVKSKKGKRSPYSIAERRVPKLIPVLGSQPAGDVSHKPGGKLPLLSVRPVRSSGLNENTQKTRSNEQQKIRSSCYLNSTSIYGRRCKHLNVRFYST